MTTAQSTTNVVVVDGSNIATEGRSLPSLAQLNEAVMAFKAEYPEATVTVVVDATFGHRIAKSEVAEFDAAIAHNELVAPPAGAVGRGDAFVLSIANKVGARIFSNDSFQEFHGQYQWLFDEGRIIGGKPVPHVGWVFVPRVPVKGPASRKATREARNGRSAPAATSRRSSSRSASEPMPVPKAPPPGARSGRRPASTAAVEQPPGPVSQDVRTTPPTPAAGAPVNGLLPFIDFVEHHPVGSSVNGVVASYSSHGAYVTIGDLQGYVPLRLMSDPPPRSARDVMRVGDAVTLVVSSFSPSRRSVDLAVPAMAAAETSAAAPVAPVPTKRTRAKKVAAPPEAAAPLEVVAPSAPPEVAAPLDVVAPSAPAEVAEPVPDSKPTRRRRAGATAKAPTAAARSAAVSEDEQVTAASRRRRRSGAAAAAALTPTDAPPATGPADVTPRPTRRRSSARSDAPAQQAPREDAGPRPPVTDASPARSKKAAAKAATTSSSPSKRAPAKQAPAEQPAVTRTARPPAAAKKLAASEPAKQTTKRSAATKSPTKKAVAKKAAG